MQKQLFYWLLLKPCLSLMLYLCFTDSWLIYILWKCYLRILGILHIKLDSFRVLGKISESFFVRPSYFVIFLLLFDCIVFFTCFVGILSLNNCSFLIYLFLFTPDTFFFSKLKGGEWINGRTRAPGAILTAYHQEAAEIAPWAQGSADIYTFHWAAENLSSRGLLLQ